MQFHLSESAFLRVDKHLVDSNADETAADDRDTEAKDLQHSQQDNVPSSRQPASQRSNHSQRQALSGRMILSNRASQELTTDAMRGSVRQQSQSASSSRGHLSATASDHLSSPRRGLKRAYTDFMGLDSTSAQHESHFGFDVPSAHRELSADFPCTSHAADFTRASSPAIFEASNDSRTSRSGRLIRVPIKFTL